ncbi:VOC family protein, partial [Streptomyces sp. NPDC000405]|uniref:VOC family protein n=1 Tax=Streptomyces sp. NPDC000405 TaxID=3161033 RepID=UPI00398D3350
ASPQRPSEGDGPSRRWVGPASRLSATLHQVVGLGGQVLKPAHDSAHGRVATVADPEGARFSVIQSPR